VSGDGFVFDRAEAHLHRVALAADGREYTYAELSAASAEVAVRLLDGRDDLAGRRVAFLVKPGFDWVAVQWGTWRAGGIAVPLALSHPARELQHVIEDCSPFVVIADAALADRVRAIARSLDIPFIETERLLSGSGPGAESDAVGFEPAAPSISGSPHGSAVEEPEPGTPDPSGEPARPGLSSVASGLPRIDTRAAAMILYTSGTTGRPKGVVSTHANVTAQITALVGAWGWTEHDRILHVLPLHHVHGIINVLSCALWSGACCEFLPRFEAEPVWQRLATGRITTFMAVPTIYHRLIAAWEAATPSTRQAWSDGGRRLRLMVSGSAALPVRTLERWREITGHTLLERYGMTEIGMALSNPLQGERRAGTVGQPLAGVTARIVDDSGSALDPGHAGQIEVRGPQVFREYWQRPEETAKAFRDGWFMTGDEAVIENGCWRILGRRSMDIIKSGGYKISALEIEDALREHEAIRDCAVVGLPDADLGERVAVAVVGSRPLEAETLVAWARDRIAPYKVPREYRFVEALPRNAMGKVTKPAVRDLFG
jgi:malonyl-CoA/methylmalonyl-CoA synthetase